LDVIDILRYAMTDTTENCIMPTLHSDDKLTNRKVNYARAHTHIHIHVHMYTGNYKILYYSLGSFQILKNNRT